MLVYKSTRSKGVGEVTPRVTLVNERCYNESDKDGYIIYSLLFSSLLFYSLKGEGIKKRSENYGER